MMAAPRCCTVGMNSSSSHAWSPPAASNAGLPADLGVEHVGVLGRRVVAPDRHLVTSLTAAPALAASWALARLWSSRVMAVNCPSGVFGGVVEGDEGVGVGRVADDQDLHVRRRRGRRCALPWAVKMAPLADSRSAALHALLAGHGADEQPVVGVAERHVRRRRCTRRPPATGRRSPRAPCGRPRARPRPGVPPAAGGSPAGRRPSICPLAMRNSRAYPIWPAAPVTATRTGSFMAGTPGRSTTDGWRHRAIVVPGAAVGRR